MHTRRLLSCAAMLVAVLLLPLGGAALADNVPRMTTDELKARIGEPGLAILDVRAGGDWNGSREKIAGAVRVNSAGAGQWAGSYAKDQTVVLYCS